MQEQLIKKDILYPQLSYQIIGVLFEVYNKFGPGLQEKYYQKEIAAIFKILKIPFKEQVVYKIALSDGTSVRCFFDFVIDNKIALEIKKGDRFLKNNIDQLFSYLKISKLKLGILANFTSRGLQFKRIINLKDNS